MAILAIVHLPILIINAYGTNNTMDKSYTATMTTFGNLGSAKVVNSITIPGCDENEFQFEHCQIGQFHATINILSDFIIYTLNERWFFATTQIRMSLPSSMRGLMSLERYFSLLHGFGL